VGGGQVGLDEMDVAVNHFERGVAEEFFEDVDVSSVAEEFGGEGMAEAVDGDVLHAGAIAEAMEMAIEVAAIHMLFSEAPVAVGSGEDEVVGDGVGASGQVVEEGQGGASSELDGTGFAVFGGGGGNVGGAVFEVEVGEGEPAGFGGTNAGVQEKGDNGLVTEHYVAGDAMAAVGFGGPGGGVGAGVEESLDLFLGEDGDGGWGRAFDFDGADDIGGDKLAFGGPGPE